MDVEKAVRDGYRTTTFTFTRNEDFGEGRILCMQASVADMFNNGGEYLTSEEEEQEEEEEEPDQDD